MAISPKPASLQMLLCGRHIESGPGIDVITILERVSFQHGQILGSGKSHE
ncbi:MAG: hypothetical protein ACLQGU_05465 [bacterium]